MEWEQRESHIVVAADCNLTTCEGQLYWQDRKSLAALFYSTLVTESCQVESWSKKVDKEEHVQMLHSLSYNKVCVWTTANH